MNPEKPGLINGHMTKSTRSILIIDISYRFGKSPWSLDMKVFPICQSLSCFRRGGQAVTVVGTVIQTHSNWSAIRPLDSHS